MILMVPYLVNPFLCVWFVFTFVFSPIDLTPPPLFLFFFFFFNTVMLKIEKSARECENVINKERSEFSVSLETEKPVFFKLHKRHIIPLEWSDRYLDQRI